MVLYFDTTYINTVPDLRMLATNGLSGYTSVAPEFIHSVPEVLSQKNLFLTLLLIFDYLQMEDGLRAK